MYPGEGGYPGEGMDLGEQTTGTRDEHYNLVSVLYHSLHGAENCDLYALDAEAAGRGDLLDFFREAQIVQTGLAERAKELLGISSAVPEAGLTPEGGVVPPETVPPEIDVVEDDVLLEEEPLPEDVPPRMEQTGTGIPPEIAVPDEDPAVTDIPPEPAMPDEAPPGEERPLRP